MRAKKTVIQRRGRIVLAQYEYTEYGKRKCVYVVSYGDSKFSNFSFIGRDLFVTDEIQLAVDNVAIRTNV